MNVIVRFPPSPTGNFHIGSARTALFNYLFAQKHGGTFLLRFEDTDKKRSERKYEEDILSGLAWLGITPDKEPVRQSERTEIYTHYLEALLEKGSAYEAEASKEGAGNVIRFKNPNTRISFNDSVRGDVEVETNDLDDFVIAKNKKEPLYHLAVVVDDAESGVTHVIRGEDHISNTPRQILLLEALGFDRPHYAHIPFILAPDKSKLSKRHGAVSLSEYERKGYLPEAMINYLALLGWHPKDDQEIFTREELIRQFDLTRVQKGGAVFDEEKLRWINKEHLAKLSDDAYLKLVRNTLPKKYHTEMLERLMPIFRERVSVLEDVVAMAEEGELDYFYDTPAIDTEELVWKDTSKTKTKEHLLQVTDLINNIKDNNYNKESIKAVIWDYATKEGRGEVLWPMRYALSGKKRSPDPFILATILGKKEVETRLKTVADKLS